MKLQALSSIKFTVHFQPDMGLLKNKYYSKETSVLEFPISICCSQTKLDKDSKQETMHNICPPDNVIVYSLLTHGLTIEPQFIDLGEVTTQETVYADVILRNESVLFRTSVFPYLPKCLTIGPGYGIMEMLPKEEVKFRLYFSPSADDIKGTLLLYILL